jgi:phenylalanyl-tRNA synthetase alpha chain
MRENLIELRTVALEALKQCREESDVEAVRVAYLGRKGELTTVVRGMRDVPPEERPEIGRLLNEIKDEVEKAIVDALDRARAQVRARRVAEERVDVTVPGRRPRLGRLHPLTQVMEELVDVFRSLGFTVHEGPDIEDDYHNFAALNFPPDHPARDMQDTLFVEDGWLLRTHTSPVQIRVMETHRPPLRVIVPGAVYRHDSDTTHSPMFHQIEGFMVDRRVTFGDLKGVLTHCLRRIFGIETPVRLRASFFPFTEPSVEVDIGCFRCGGREMQCRICKGTGWMEILGAGMIDPNVFRAVGYDPEEVSGFAFGLGVERMAMLRYQIDDIRLFYSGDERFLRQF